MINSPLDLFSLELSTLKKKGIFNYNLQGQFPKSAKCRPFWDSNAIWWWQGPPFFQQLHIFLKMQSLVHETKFISMAIGIFVNYFLRAYQTFLKKVMYIYSFHLTESRLQDGSGVEGITPKAVIYPHPKKNLPPVKARERGLFCPPGILISPF